MQVAALAGSDLITVDTSNGNFADNVVIAGGTPGSAPGDSLVLSGNSYTTVTHTETAVGAGTVAFSGTTMTVTYSGLEAVTDAMTAQNRVFNFDGGAETVTLTDDSNVGDGESQITSTVGTPIIFRDPTVSLSINAGTGNDAIVVTSVDSKFGASVSIDGGALSDSIQVNAPLTLGSGTSLGTVDLTAETIAINAPIDTSAVTTGTIDLTGDTVTLSSSLMTGNSDVTINAANSLTFSGAAASINAGTGDVSVIQGATGAVTSGTAATDIIADDVSITSGSGGIGASGNPLRTNANTLTTSTSNADQYLSEVNSVSIASGDLSAGTGTINLVSGTFLTTPTGSVLTSAVVGNGATLAGNGTSSSTQVLSGGTISPGTPPAGIATLNTGDLDLNVGSTFIADLALPTAGNYDQLKVTGTVDVTGSTLSLVPVAGLGAASGTGATIVLLNNDGVDPVVGQFAGYPDGALVFLDGTGFVLSYSGGDGNDITLKVPVFHVYVDDDWALLPFGTDPDGAGPAIGIGLDAFPTI